MPRTRWASWAFALALVACAGRSPLVQVDNLVALLPAAEVKRELGDLDLATPAAREHLAAGWYSTERSPGGERFVWSRGDASLFDFFLAAPRDLKVELGCAPLPVAGVAGVAGPPQVIALSLNGHRLGAIELADGMRAYAFRLPRAALLAGANELEFRYRTVSTPDRANGKRRLAVRWRALRFRPAPPAGAEPPRPDHDGLYLPFGTEVVYYLGVPARSELAWDRVDLRAAGGRAAAGRGSGGGRLMVAARDEGGASRVLEVEAGSARQAVDLPGQGSRLLRVALRAIAGSPDAPDAAGGGLWLKAPEVRAPAPAVPGAAKAAQAPPSRPDSGRSGPVRPNIVMYLVDTLRADRLGCYGAKQPTSPTLDAFVRGATLFARAIAQSTWTRPSVASILTGLAPPAHGVETLADRLPEAAVTLPTILRAAGYRTAAFSTNPQVSAATGLAQGFDDFDLRPSGTRSGEMNRLVLRWLDQHRGRSPFFLYIHTIDPHAPYDPPPALASRFAPGVPPGAGSVEEVHRAYAARGEERARRAAQLSQLYDGEVAETDHSFGELLAALRSRGLYDSALVVFVADHGEEFDEHGDLGHGNNLFAQTLDVPMVVKWPGQTRGERVAEVAQQVDLLPTVLRAAALEPPRGLPGIDLRLLAAGRGGKRRAFSHLTYEGRDGVSLVEGDWKLIFPLSHKFGAAPELFARGDRGERLNLAERNDVRAGWLISQIRLELLRAERGPAPREPIDEETRKALAALGYL
jgi:arylsulfatase A-like enzyme